MTLINRRSLIQTALLAPVGLAFATAAQAASHDISIKSFKFNSDDLAIKVGDTVTFSNADGVPHTATADDGSFDTGTLKKNTSGDVTFSTAGDFTYFCKFHRNMTGVIRVTA